MSPLVWDLGHIAHFEALWLLTRLGASSPRNDKLNEIYDPFLNPRAMRAKLKFLRREEVLTYLADIREQVLEHLAHCEFPENHALLQGGYVYWMLIQHESQHQETMLQSLDLHPSLAPYPPAYGRLNDGSLPKTVDAAARIEVAATDTDFGTEDRVLAYDNERPKHRRHIKAFLIDKYPVTCARFAQFIADNGYQRPDLWSDAGWEWQRDARVHAPQGWYQADRKWRVRQFGYEAALPEQAPVQHVCFHEAEAFARWVGGRLPTELEWELAATGSGIETSNLGLNLFSPTAIRVRKNDASALGVEQLLSDVYEWTSSYFSGYPGYQSFPYQEYSEVFFGEEYRVLRGASWATSRHCARPSFRNWDYPIRRQIFAGFRLAWDE